MSSSVDEFPFVGAVPNRDGHFLAAGFTGHGSFALFPFNPTHGLFSLLILYQISGMPRILLSTAHIAPLILSSLGIDSVAPRLLAPYPPLPKPFELTAERMERLQKIDVQKKYEAAIKHNLESAKEAFCRDRMSQLKANVVDGISV